MADTILACGIALSDCPAHSGSLEPTCHRVSTGEHGVYAPSKCIYYGLYLVGLAAADERMDAEPGTRSVLSVLTAAVDRIQDNTLRRQTMDVLSTIPIRSWQAPSSRDHHLEDERGEWGNLLHTIRVTCIASDMADALDLPQYQRDLLRSAAILHDCAKHGVDGELPYITSAHPELASVVIARSGSDLPSQVSLCVRMHMGRWGTTPVDWTGGDIGGVVTLALLLHLADCIEARLPRVLKVDKAD